jgi:hypothetical protein
MALELGGRADKFGNDYERQWIIRQALRLLDGEATSIHWELLGDEGDGVEFQLCLLDGTVEGHQCKRESGTASKWTVASLRKVLPKAKKQIVDGHISQFVFVSRLPVPVLRDLAERSHTCNNDGVQFRDHSVSNKHRVEFDRLCALWGVEASDSAQLAEMLRVLQGLRFKIWDESREDVERAAARLAKGQPRDIVACIGDFLFQSIGTTVHVDHLQKHLQLSGYPLWNIRPDDVASAVERLRTEFEASVDAALIDGSLIRRTESVDLRSRLQEADGPRTIFLHGASGAGKSGVLLEVMRDLAKEGVVVLPVRLDIHRPDSTLEAFSESLGLPAPPSDCLSALATGRRAVLILDQLDAIRWTGGHAAQAWTICKAIMERAVDYHDVRVVVACRTFDLNDDQQIKVWEGMARESQRHRLERIEVKELSQDIVKEVVEAHGVLYEPMSPRELALLANPQCLYVWCAIRQWGNQTKAYDTQSDILSEFLGRVRRRVIDEMGVPSTDYDALLSTFVEYLDRNSRLDAPRGSLAQYHKALDGLQSIGIVQHIGDRIRFTHQSYFDHLVAARVLDAVSRDDRAPVEWLRNSDQTLFHRQQLRQLLVLLRDREPAGYASTLRALIADGDIRFHLKHLTLNHLRAIGDPNELERPLVLEWLASDEWRVYVLEESVAGNARWFDVVDDEGLVASWLRSGHADLVEKARWLCSEFARERPHRVEAHLRIAWDAADEESRRFVDWAMPHAVEHLTDAMFEWRLERVRSGHYPLDVHQAALVAKKDGARAVRMLEAFLDRALGECEVVGASRRRRRIDLSDERSEPLELACGQNASKVWDLLAPALDRALDLQEQLTQQIEVGKTEDDQYTRRSELRPILSLLARMLVQAGGALSSSAPEVAISRIATLKHPKADTTRRLIAGMLAQGDPEHLSDYAIEWLCSDRDNLEIRDFAERPVDDPSRLLIQRMSPHCSNEVFQRLESTVLAYHTEWEKETIRGQVSRNQKNEYGKPQSILLSAMPPSRLSDAARQRRTMYLEKFGPVEDYRSPDRGAGGFIGSPIDHKAAIISDAQWVQIISKGEGSQDWRQVGPDRIEESSPRTFSRVLLGAAHKEPERFARLALLIPRDAPVAYHSALLRGLSEPAAPRDTVGWKPAAIADVERVFQHVSPVCDADVASAICWAVRCRPTEAWSVGTRDLIRDMTNTVVEPSPIMEATCTEPAQEDLHSTSLNCLQGKVADAIAALTFANQDLVPEFLPTIRTMVRDSRPAVRLAAIETIGPVYNYDRDMSASLFLEACSHGDDRILASRGVRELLKYLRMSYAKRIRPLLERMAGSRLPSVAEAGAFWATIQEHTMQRDSDISDACSSGTVHQRQGVVGALVALCEQDEWRAGAHGPLTAFFNDVDEVLQKAVDVFSSKRVLGDGAWGPALALTFTSSLGFQRKPSGLMDHLESWEGSLVHYADAIFHAVERISGELAGYTRDVSRDGLVGKDAMTVVLRLYGEAHDRESRNLRDRCLDALDALLKGRVGFVKDKLEQLDAE